MSALRRSALVATGLVGGVVALRALLRMRRRIEFQGRVVVIAGGSRGLGLALARQFADEGARLALLARDEDELRRAVDELEDTGTEVISIASDIGSREEVRDAIGQVLDTYGRIDVLVNVAGLMQVGPQETLRMEDFREAMRVHAWGPLHTMRAVIGPMTRQRGGRIVNIVSIGGKVAVPHMASYALSKFALAGLSDAMRNELDRAGIRVTTVYPGLMRTGSHVQAEFRGRPEKEFGWFAALAGSPFTSTSAASAARSILNACRYGDRQLVITFPAKVVAVASALMPSLVADGFALMNRLLPGAVPLGLVDSRLGWQSRRRGVLNWLARPADRAIGDHNQHQPSASRPYL